MRLDHQDTVRFTPAHNKLIGERFKHNGNGVIYTVTGFVWFGDMDRWLIIHEADGEQFVRTPENLEGRLRDGRKRVVWL